MKNIFKTLLFTLFTHLAFSQNQQVFRLTNTPKGIFVEIGKPEFVGRDFDLMRKTGDGSFKKIVSLDAPNRENQLKRRIDDTEKVFVENARPTEKNIDETWKNFKDKKPNLNKFIALVPQLEFIFGLAYLDDEVKPNEKYQYQLVEKRGTLATSKTITYSKYHQMPKLLMANQSKQGADLKMDFNYPAEQQLYSKFYVKRKLFSSQNTDYQFISPLITFSTKNKITTLSIIDTTLKSYSAYNYQIRVGDIFGNLDSTTYNFEGNNVPERLVVIPQNIKVEAQENKRNLLISWTLPQNQTIQSIKLLRSRDFDKDFRVIANLNGNETSFDDKIDIANELYHYYFEVHDIFGNINKSIKFKGVYDKNYVPSPPNNLAIKQNTKGVELTWESSDKFTRGFYVFRKQGQRSEFLQISPLIFSRQNEGKYIDSTRLDFDNTYFYAVKAESDTYNKSSFSESISFKAENTSSRNSLKPPYDLNAVFRNDKVMLNWENVNAENSQVLGYQVFRKADSEKEYKLLTEKAISFRHNFYEDSTFFSEEKYQYAIVCTDLRNNFSLKSQPISIDLNGRFLMIPENIGAEVLANEIKLKWTEIDIDRIKNIKIYRAEDNANFKLLTTLQKNKQDYSDTAVQKGKNYVYKISTIDLAGKESLTSEVFSINY